MDNLDLPGTVKYFLSQLYDVQLYNVQTVQIVHNSFIMYTKRIERFKECFPNKEKKSFFFLKISSIIDSKLSAKLIVKIVLYLKCPDFNCCFECSNFSQII